MKGLMVVVTLCLIGLVVVGCGRSAQEEYYGNKLAEEKAQKAQEIEKECHNTTFFIRFEANFYASNNDGRYPTSWDDLLPYMEGWDEPPTCPLDKSEYKIFWSSSSPPTIECPNHG